MLGKSLTEHQVQVQNAGGAAQQQQGDLTNCIQVQSPGWDDKQVN